MRIQHQKLKVAVVHEWLTSYAGSEKVLEQILTVYPKADLFVTVDFLPETDRKKLKFANLHTSFVQKLPFAKKHYRSYLPIMPIAIEQFDLSKYDLIISSNHAVAKGVLTKADQLHICYCHSPMRYAWDLYHEYLKESQLNKGLKSLFVRYFLHKLRLWDHRTAHGVDAFVANSKYVARRINKIYGRAAEVIHPCIDIRKFKPLGVAHNRQLHFLTASRFVPYKRIDLIIKAFNQMPNLTLKVIGDGPDKQKLKALAKSNIEFLGAVADDQLVHELQICKGFVFAAEEDFGILPVEAQACGTPIIAYGRGGALDSVIPGKTGLFFYEQNTESLVDVIKQFELLKWDYQHIRFHAEKFDKEIFNEILINLIESKFDELVQSGLIIGKNWLLADDQPVQLQKDSLELKQNV